MKRVALTTIFSSSRLLASVIPPPPFPNFTPPPREKNDHLGLIGFLAKVGGGADGREVQIRLKFIGAFSFH